MKLKDGFHGERSLVIPKAILDIIEDDPLASNIYITDIGHYPAASHHYRIRREPIDQYVFIYWVDGRGWYEADGERHDVGRGHYFILPVGIPHSYGANDDDPWTIYWIHFKGPLAGYYADGCTTPLEVSPGADSRIRDRTSLFEEIFSTLSSSFAIESIRYAMASFQHYLATLRYIRQYRNAADNPDNTGIADAVIRYFGENTERRLTLAEIAEYSGLSPSRLSVVFKERTGHSPLAYFNLMKIRRACELLDTSSMKLNQISFKLGIDDQFYFSRLFSRIMGMSPKAYRNQNKI